MKRWPFRIVLFLLLGVVTTVGVAWGCMYFFSPRWRIPREYADRIVDGLWPLPYPHPEWVYGWPLVVLTNGYPIEPWMVITPSAYDDELQLLTPIWSGFAINTVFYAAILWMLWLSPFVVRRFIRRRRGRCIKCGYDLRGAEHEACPECGIAGGPTAVASG